jgi:GTP-binding protein HflX
MRKRRMKSGVPVISCVGYTNAGKSTVMNMLSKAGVLEENKLFATLDTTTRRVRTQNGAEYLLTDTVGFIRKLPHHLVKAFRATLEELAYADLLLHVVDAADPARDGKMAVVYETLNLLECSGKPVITAFNKMDLAPPLPLPEDTRALFTRRISAKRGEGKEELTAAIETALEVNKFHKLDL